MLKLLAPIALAGTIAAPLASGLTESARLSSVYDAILHARFDAAQQAIDHTCPPAPAAACLTLEAAAIWWQIQMDPNSRALDSRIDTISKRAIETAAARTTCEPERAEAWFYLAGSYGPLVQWRILRGERLSAARDAKRIKDALERALAIDPSLHDAHFGIGLYRYYADVVPAALKVLRWLLLMPGGDRVEGLKEMLLARDRGVLLGGEADYQLHWLYLWYEHQPDRALALLEGLDARYPSNPIFLQRMAEVQRDYRHDRTAAIAAWQELLARSSSRRVERPEMASVRARIGLAQEYLESQEARGAVDVLMPIADRPIAAPYGAQALTQFVLGCAHEALGDATRARAAFDQAIATAPPDDPDNIRSRARTHRSALAQHRQ